MKIVEIFENILDIILDRMFVRYGSLVAFLWGILAPYLIWILLSSLALNKEASQDQCGYFHCQFPHLLAQVIVLQSSPLPLSLSLYFFFSLSDINFFSLRLSSFFSLFSVWYFFSFALSLFHSFALPLDALVMLLVKSRSHCCKGFLQWLWLGICTGAQATIQIVNGRKTFLNAQKTYIFWIISGTDYKF